MNTFHFKHNALVMAIALAAALAACDRNPPAPKASPDSPGTGSAMPPSSTPATPPAPTPAPPPGGTSPSTGSTGSGTSGS